MRRLLRLACIACAGGAGRSPRAGGRRPRRRRRRPRARRRPSRCSRTAAGCSPTPSRRGRSRPPTSRRACPRRRARWCACSIRRRPKKRPAPGRVYVTNLNDVLSKGRAPGPADVARGVRDRGAGRAPDRRVVAAGRADDAARRRCPPSTAGPAAPPAAGRRRTAGRHHLRDLVVRRLPGRAPVPDRAARSRSPTRTSRRDADAARELAAKAAKMGIPTDRVPVIDVRGRLLLGFDGRASRRCWESRHDEAALAGRRWRWLAAARAGRRAAEARVIDLRLGGNAGGMFGWGTTPNTPDFFRQAAGPGFGVRGRASSCWSSTSPSTSCRSSTAAGWAGR